MDSLELKPLVRRLNEGECPYCHNKLTFVSNECNTGVLEKNGMPEITELIDETHEVFCRICGYSSYAVQIGLRLIPIDRIYENDINWDKKYLVDNTLVYGEKGKNPFNKDKE